LQENLKSLVKRATSIELRESASTAADVFSDAVDTRDVSSQHPQQAFTRHSLPDDIESSPARINCIK